MSFKRKIHGSTLKNQRIFEKKVPFSSKAYMMPLLKSSLDDFVIPLTILLRYRYQTTNENYSFKTVETDVSKLKELFPGENRQILKALYGVSKMDILHLQTQIMQPTIAVIIFELNQTPFER